MWEHHAEFAREEIRQLAKKWINQLGAVETFSATYEDWHDEYNELFQEDREFSAELAAIDSGLGVHSTRSVDIESWLDGLDRMSWATTRWSWTAERGKVLAWRDGLQDDVDDKPLHFFGTLDWPGCRPATQEEKDELAWKDMFRSGGN